METHFSNSKGKQETFQYKTGTRTTVLRMLMLDLWFSKADTATTPLSRLQEDHSTSSSMTPRQTSVAAKFRTWRSCFESSGKDSTSDKDALGIKEDDSDDEDQRDSEGDQCMELLDHHRGMSVRMRTHVLRWEGALKKKTKRAPLR